MGHYAYGRKSFHLRYELRHRSSSIRPDSEIAAKPENLTKVRLYESHSLNTPCPDRSEARYDFRVYSNHANKLIRACDWRNVGFCFRTIRWIHTRAPCVSFLSICVPKLQPKPDRPLAETAS